ALPGEAAEAGFAVGRIFLTVDSGAGVIDDDITAAKVIAQLVFDGWSRIVRERSADTHECDALLVIYDMERVVLARRAALHGALIFAYAIYVHRDFVLPTLFAH